MIIRFIDYDSDLIVFLVRLCTKMDGFTSYNQAVIFEGTASCSGISLIVDKLKGVLVGCGLVFNSDEEC